ncbi:MAG: hypothetical protein ACE366_04045 [Bradymonadia bacterium]
MLRHTLVPFFALTLGALAFTACDDDDGDSGSSGGNGAAANCQSRCEAKLVDDCGQGSQLATPYCGDVCDAAPTEEQLSCAEAKSCDDLLGEIASGEAVCGIVIGSGGNGGGGGGGGEECPELMCDCDGTPVNGSFEFNGECIEECDRACEVLQQIGG